MNSCLWCHDELIMPVNWETLFLPKNRKMCTKCFQHFEKLEGDQCEKCSRPYSKNICLDCKKWELLYNGEDPLEKNISIFTYNSFMKEFITRWKYQGDYILGEVFQDLLRSHFKKGFTSFYKQALIMPIPLSEERLHERAFNQSELLATFLPGEISIYLKRQYSEKQAKKTRMQRMTAKNPFILKETINKPVILVDDIYTTGRTLRHAAILLKEKGSPAVFGFTLIRG